MTRWFARGRNLLLQGGGRIGPVLRGAWQAWKHGPRWVGALEMILAAVTVLWPLQRSVAEALSLAQPDSRETARVWIVESIPTGSRIAIESYAPYVAPGRFNVESFARIIDHPPGWYRERGFEYAIFSDGMFGRFFREPERYAEQVERYEEFFQSLVPVRLFEDGGYDLRVYRFE